MVWENDIPLASFRILLAVSCNSFDDDDDVYLIQIAKWQWVIKSISILIRTSQNGISTK
jgi:hypothetical protein